MSTPSDIESASRPGQTPAGASDGSWAAALATLVSARIELVRHESREAGRHWAKSAVLLAVAAVSALVAWLAAVAGGVAAIAAATAWPWYWLALAAAALHLVLAAGCVWRARAGKSPSFPLTRNEFTQDREWLKSLDNPRK